MEQVRAMKIGLEARLKRKVESDWKIMEWITELAGELLSRGQVGKDGRTPYLRLYGRNNAKAFLEIGDQVMAKPFEWSQIPEEVVFEGTLGVRDVWY